MFILESTLDGAGTVLKNDILMTNDEAGAKGEAVVVTSGKYTKAAANVKPQYILVRTTAAGTNVANEAVPVRDDQVYLADYVTASTGVPVAGTKGFRIDATGLNVDADQASGGKVEIISVDTTKKKCRVKFVD